METRQKRRDKRLHEEIIETRRYDGGDKARKTRQSGARKALQKYQRDDNWTLHESMGYLAKYNHKTYQKDKLQPLKRWLHTQVGRPWDAVYSELLKQTGVNPLHRSHLIEHIQPLVGTATWLDDKGHVKMVNLWGQTFKSQYFFPDFYVHPANGILCLSHPPEHEKPSKCPQKARWKAEKQRIRALIRQGIPPHKAPTPLPGVDASAWAHVRTRDKRLVPGQLFDVRIGICSFRAALISVSIDYRNYRLRMGEKVIYKYLPTLKIKVKVCKVGQGTLYLMGETHQFTATEGEVCGWELFDQKRLF